MQGFMLFRLFLLSFVWLVVFFSSLHGFSQVISLIGVYHSPNIEKFSQKIWEIAKCNGALSLPIIFSLNLLVQTSLTNVDEKCCFYLSLPITALSLMVIRILANPSKSLKPSHCRYYSESEMKLSTVALHKERVLSFVYAFIISAIIILLLLLCYDALMQLPFNRIEMPQLTPLEIMECFAAYVTTLGVATLLGEAILIIRPPIIQNYIKNN
jgi:hypothetical protein